MRTDGNAWTMWRGDCLDVMRGLDLGDFALVVADPPYGVAERTDRKAKGRSKMAECNDFAPVIGGPIAPRTTEDQPK